MTVAAKKPSEVLRAEFPAGMVGKLPRVTCKDCSDSQGKVCGKHSKSKCAECGNYITGAHIHLDYVGHAAVTDRLLQADPGWTWEFQAANPDGSPVIFNSGLADPFAKVGLWIRLTVDGVTRPGFGEGKNFKEAIGDALRNAAMRFGVALDLWAKEDLHATDDHGSSPEPAKPAGEAAGTPGAGAAGTDGSAKAAPAPPTTTELRSQYETLARSWARMESTFDATASVRKSDEKLASAKAAGDAEPYRKFLTAQVESFMALIDRRNADLEAAVAFPIPETNLEAAGKATA